MMRKIAFPTGDDIDTIFRGSPLSEANERVLDWIRTLPESWRRNGFSGFSGAIATQELVWQLHYRLADTGKSYSFMKYFFNQGIPDDPWYVSPGRNGGSIEYFPEFEPVHFAIKDWFDYSSGNFYFGLFSALDVTGYLILSIHELPKEGKASFDRAIKALQAESSDLHERLKDVVSSAPFGLARKLRHNTAHNYLPSSAGMSVTGTKDFQRIGLREYTASRVIMQNANDAAEILNQVLRQLVDSPPAAQAAAPDGGHNYS